MGLRIQHAQGLLLPFILKSFLIVALIVTFGDFFPILLIIARRQKIHADKPNWFVLTRDRTEVFWPHPCQEYCSIMKLKSIELIPNQLIKFLRRVFKGGVCCLILRQSCRLN
jgi:hypothetical protein